MRLRGLGLGHGVQLCYEWHSIRGFGANNDDLVFCLVFSCFGHGVLNALWVNKVMVALVAGIGLVSDGAEVERSGWVALMDD